MTWGHLYAPCHLATDGVLQAGAAAAGGWEGEDEEIGAAVEGEHLNPIPHTVWLRSHAVTLKKFTAKTYEIKKF